jgi:hypothetical protein
LKGNFFSLFRIKNHELFDHQCTPESCFIISVSFPKATLPELKRGISFNICTSVTLKRRENFASRKMGYFLYHLLGSSLPSSLVKYKKRGDSFDPKIGKAF